MRRARGDRQPLIAVLLRLALAATALSLWVYVPYRYAVRPPRFDGFLGSAYAALFPLAALLALASLVAAWRPARVSRLEGPGRSVRVLRGILGGYAAAWLVMGLFCIPALTALAAASPVKGALATFHMTAQHVFLALAAIAAAWLPAPTAAILAGRPLGSPEAVSTDGIDGPLV